MTHVFPTNPLFDNFLFEQWEYLNRKHQTLHICGTERFCKCISLKTFLLPQYFYQHTQKLNHFLNLHSIRLSDSLLITNYLHLHITRHIYDLGMHIKMRYFPSLQLYWHLHSTFPDEFIMLDITRTLEHAIRQLQ